MTRDGLGDVEDEGGEAVARAALAGVRGRRLLLLLWSVHPSRTRDVHVRGHYQIDVQSCHSRLISPEIFKQLSPYESPEYALSNEVW